MSERIKRQIRQLRDLGVAKRRRGRPPRQQPPDLVEAAYAREISSLSDRLYEAIEQILIPELASFEVRLDTVARRDADITQLLKELRKRLADIVTIDQARNIANRWAQATADHQREQLKKQMQAALGVDLFQDASLAELFRGFVLENVQLIQDVPAKLLADVEKLVTRDLANGLRHEVIAKNIRKEVGVSKKRAQLIARDQVGKFYGRVQKQRQSNLGVTHYIWRTVRDNRVRESHESLDGERFAWDSPPAVGHPGSDINCRCYADPDLSTILGE